MLAINNLTKHYGKNEVLSELTMSVDKGSIYAFVGENGAGKTTTIKIITGLLKEDSGEIILHGKNMNHLSRMERSCIGYMPDFFGVYDRLKVYEYMEFYASLYGIDGKKGKSKIEELLELVNLKEYKSQYVDALSKGMKQRLCLARTLVHEPELLLLDEPTNGLDPNGRQEMNHMLQSLRDQGKTILISSHILPELSKIATHIGILDKGRMKISGSVKEIIESREFGRPLCIEVLEDIQQCVNLIKPLESVRNIIIQDNKLLVTFFGDEIEESKLLMRLVQEGIMVRSFKREESDLEQVFMKLTHDTSNGGNIET